MTSRQIALILAGTLLNSPACCENKGVEAGTDAPTTATNQRFQGTYNSNWGTTIFEQTGSTITARYPRGSMTCTAAGDILTCDWFEGSQQGKARLTRQSSGDIKGTWGKGSSATNGGPWTFTRISDSLGSTSGSETNFAGTYASNWGTTTFTQDGNIVQARFPGGSMRCTATGNTLNCTWNEGGSTGRARLVRNDNGFIAGSWGNGSSSTNGGPWTFAPQ